ncbi:MAG: hypothetical protein BWY81_01180 [Firmicutes bacterium ADurb.Bin467]|nr:MAG: hypothetical protein BWY81_01180 [Firmicutes bacterium ADurb.Bin467]
MPKSPRKRFFQYSIYCSPTGLSRPYFAATRASSSGGTFFCSLGLNGPPGIMCIRKNEIVISTITVKTPAIRRFKM